VTGTVAFDSPSGPIVVSVEVPEAWELACTIYPDLRMDVDGRTPELTVRKGAEGYELVVPQGAWSSELLSDVLI